MSYVHQVRVRYGECDMQKVVFNAHYFAYCDDAIDTWFRMVLAPGGGGYESMGFDCMVKAAVITWHAPLVFGEIVDLACSIGRWGSSSFDVSVVGTVEGADRFEATITYVSVAIGENRAVPVPQHVREALAG